MPVSVAATLHVYNKSAMKTSEASLFQNFPIFSYPTVTPHEMITIHRNSNQSYFPWNFSVGSHEDLIVVQKYLSIRNLKKVYVNADSVFPTSYVILTHSLP